MRAVWDAGAGRGVADVSNQDRLQVIVSLALFLVLLHIEVDCQLDVAVYIQCMAHTALGQHPGTILKRATTKFLFGKTENMDLCWHSGEMYGILLTDFPYFPIKKFAFKF